MKQNRRLALRREALTELTNDELSLAGGALDTRLTIKATCSADDLQDLSRDIQLRLTLHPHCSWSCI